MKEIKSMSFNVSEAIEYSSAGRIEEWVHIFLTTVGENIPFSEGLKLFKRYWLGPTLCDLNKFIRCCGPENDLKYYESPQDFEKRVSSMEALIKKNWDMPPLIVKHDKGQFELSDGNHRYEALKRAGIKQFWVIFWDTEDNLSGLSEELNNR